MNKKKHGSRKLPPANLKSQIWFVVCSKMTKPRSYGLFASSMPDNGALLLKVPISLLSLA